MKNNNIRELTHAQISKLPKYGQSYIRHLEGELYRFKRKLIELEAEYQLAVNPEDLVSNVSIETVGNINRDIYLPPQSRIKFFLSSDPLDYFHVRHLVPEEREKAQLYVSHSNETVTLIPRASNTVLIRREIR